MLERTANGLSNAHLFHGVDFIMYVEGRHDEEQSDHISFDQYFWRCLSEVFALGKKIRVLSRGSKNNLRPIATEIVSGNVDNTLVAFDRDYDFECSNNISHPRVLYTHGYSWENDVWCIDQLKAVVKDFYLGENLSPEVENEFQACVDAFYRKARWVAKLNLIAAVSEKKYVVGSSHMNGLVSLTHDLPIFNNNCLRSAIRNCSISRPCVLTINTEISNSHVQGHLAAHFGYHFVCKALAKLGQGGKICINMLTISAINIFKTALAVMRPACSEYYSDQFSSAVA